MAQRASRSIRFNAEHADDPGPEKVLNELLFFLPQPVYTRPIRVCAAQRGRDFEAPGLERGIHFRRGF